MTFYVDNHKTAQSLNQANLKLQMKDGWKVGLLSFFLSSQLRCATRYFIKGINFSVFFQQVQIKVVPNIPFVELNPELKEKIKLVMSSKYNAMAGHLDLSKFYANEGKPQLSILVSHFYNVTPKFTEIEHRQ